MAGKTKKRAARARPARVAKELPRAIKRDGGQRLMSNIGGFVIPLILCALITGCISVVAFMGYSTVTASNFFDVASVDIRGIERASKKDIATIVNSNAEKTGVWNADLLEIKQKIEKVTFVKNAAVSRVLPNGIAVQVVERLPAAVVRIGTKDFLADAEGSILAPAEKNEKRLPFAMLGWDEAKSEKAGKENVERLKMYQKMLVEWQDYNLATRVRSVDLADTREPKAILEDSGLPVTIALGKENFGHYLSNGIKAILGKGQMFEGVNLVGQNMILQPRKP